MKPVKPEIPQGTPTSAFCPLKLQDEGDRVFKIPEMVTLWLISIGLRGERKAHHTSEKELWTQPCL